MGAGNCRGKKDLVESMTLESIGRQLRLDRLQAIQVGPVLLNVNTFMKIMLG